jgi:hypothetical protein
VPFAVAGDHRCGCGGAPGEDGPHRGEIEPAGVGVEDPEHAHPDGGDSTGEGDTLGVEQQGRHFAAFEQPEIFVREVRDGIRAIGR